MRLANQVVVLLKDELWRAMSEEINLNDTTSGDISESRFFISFIGNDGNLSVRVVEVHAKELGLVLALEHDEGVCAVGLVTGSGRIVRFSEAIVETFISTFGEAELLDTLTEAIDISSREFEIKSYKLIIKYPLLLLRGYVDLGRVSLVGEGERERVRLGRETIHAGFHAGVLAPIELNHAFRYLISFCVSGVGDFETGRVEVYSKDIIGRRGPRFVVRSCRDCPHHGGAVGEDRAW